MLSGTAIFWTHLCCEGRELLERRYAILTELPRADHVCGFDPSQRRSSRMERFEAEHWPSNSLDETVVLLNNIAEVFGLKDVDNLTNSGEFEDDVQALQAS